MSSCASPFANQRANHFSKEEHDGQDVQQPTPLPPSGPAAEVAADPQEQRKMKHGEGGVEGEAKRDGDAQDRREDKGRVGKNHGEDKPEKNGVQQRVVGRTRGNGTKNEDQHPPQQQPAVPEEQADGNESVRPSCRTVRQATS